MKSPIAPTSIRWPACWANVSTGTPPFRADSIERLVAAHLMEPAPRPSQLRPGRVPAALDEVVAKGMAKNPEERYRSAGDLANAALHALTAPEQHQAESILQHTEDAANAAHHGSSGGRRRGRPWLGAAPRRRGRLDLPLRRPVQRNAGRPSPPRLQSQRAAAARPTQAVDDPRRCGSTARRRVRLCGAAARRTGGASRADKTCCRSTVSTSASRPEGWRWIPPAPCTSPIRACTAGW